MGSNIPEFGIKRKNEERRDGGCAVIFDPKSQKYAVGRNERNGILILFGGGVDDRENIKEGVLREVREESGLCDFSYFEKISEALCHFYNTNKKINRIAHATCFLGILNSLNLMQTKFEAHENFTLHFLTPVEILKNWDSNNQNKDRDHWIYFLKKSVVRARELGYDKAQGELRADL